MTWEEVRDLKKSGDRRAAWKHGQALLEKDPRDFRTRSQLEWICFDRVKGAVNRIDAALKGSKQADRDDIRAIDKALSDFWTLPGVQVPGMACSNILRSVAKVAAHIPSYEIFVDWVREDGLREEDLLPNEFEGKTYPPLVVGVARGLAKWVKAQAPGDADAASAAVQWLRLARRHAGQDTQWIDWDLAVMLRMSGNHAEATTALSEVLKAKRNEFWVWAEAARLHQDQDPDLAVACFCQALTCPADPEFLVKVHGELAALLAERGEVEQASQEVVTALGIRESKGWPPGKALEEMVASDWYSPDPTGAEPADRFYVRHSPEALTLLFDNVRTVPATYLGQLNLPPPKDAKPGWKPRPRPRFAIRGEGGIAMSLLAPYQRKVPWRPGQAVALLLGRHEGSTDDTVVRILTREDGPLWDCPTPGVGVVVRTPTEGHSMRVFAGKDLGEVNVDGGSLSDHAWALGQGARFLLTVNPRNGRLEAFNVQPGPLPKQDVQLFSGELRRAEGGFGFAGDVFVAPPLVSGLDPTVSHVEGLAIYAKHPKKDGYGWRAAAITPATAEAVEGE